MDDRLAPLSPGHAHLSSPDHAHTVPKGFLLVTLLPDTDCYQLAHQLALADRGWRRQGAWPVSGASVFCPNESFRVIFY